MRDPRTFVEVIGALTPIRDELHYEWLLWFVCDTKRRQGGWIFREAMGHIENWEDSKVFEEDPRVFDNEVKGRGFGATDVS